MPENYEMVGESLPAWLTATDLATDMEDKVVMHFGTILLASLD
jgi:hypothetical protein